MPLLLLEHVTVKEPPRTSYAEVFIAVLILPLSCVLRNFLILPFPSLEKNQKVHLAVEHCLLLLPFAPICFENVLSDQTYLLVCLAWMASVVVLCLLIVVFSPKRSQPSSPDLFHATAAEAASRSAEIGQFRALVYFSTVVCIFARDLAGFRLRFAKSLAYGTALMDVGVGSFVFCMGMTGPTARKPASEWEDISFRNEIRGSFRVALFLLAIGVVKLLFNLTFGIAQPQYEYGSHWNVFFTLAFVKITGPIFELCSAYLLPPALLGVVISVGFELIQEKWLKRYLLYKASRVGFLDANREGIIQLPGLLALYLIGLEIGRPLLRWRSHPLGKVKSAVYLLAVFTITCAGGNAGKFYKLMEIESRMCTNFAYVLFMTAFPTFFLGIIFVLSITTDFLLKRKGAVYYVQDSLLYRLDRVGFIFFMIGNLLTGLSHVLPRVPSLSVVYLILYTSLSVALAIHTCAHLQSMLSVIFRGDILKLPDIFLKEKENSKRTEFGASIPLFQRPKDPE